MMSRLWPARTQKMDNGPIADLDAIVAEPISFRFKGKIHTLKPVDLKDFLKFTNAQAALMNAANDPAVKMTAKELAKRYFDVIEPLCHTITIEDVMSMEQVQIAALYQLIIDMVTGQIDMGDGKKKRQKISIYDTAQHSSSQSVQESSGGPQRPL